MKLSKSRIIDFCIYIACGLVVAIGAFAPIVMGINMDWYLPRGMAVASSLALVALLAYDLRFWVRRPTLWLFLLTIAALNVVGAVELQRNDASFNIVGWVIASTIQLYFFEWLFKRLARMLGSGE